MLLIHNPRYAYDCDPCKFNWCCGPTCACLFFGTLPKPPKARQREVDAALIAKGYEPEYGKKQVGTLLGRA